MREVIAEIGVNWNNDLTLAMELIAVAKKSGATAAKFQFYSAEALFGVNGDAPNPEIYTQMRWMDKVSDSDAEVLAGYCSKIGIEFFASAFDTERLGWLEKIGVKRHKLASRSIALQPEYCAAVAKTVKPIIASAGLGVLPEVHNTLSGIVGPVTWLYCVSEYPAPLSHVDMPDFTGETYVEGVQPYSGFSDHTIGSSAAIYALSRGATIVEVHFTLDRSLPGPDHVCSKTPQELAQIVQYARDIDILRGEVVGEEEN